MKVLRQKNLFGILFAVLLCLPMFSILGRTAYTVVNKNAYQSYSDYSYQVDAKLDFDNFNDLIVNQEYIVDLSNVDFTSTYNSSSYFVQYENLSIPNNYNAYYFTLGASIAHSNEYSISFYDSSKTWLGRISLSNYTDFTFVYLGYATGPTAAYYYNNFYGAKLITYQLITNTGTLDNAFEYSVNQVIDNNNFGELDFFEWFTDMFLDSSNTTNAMYVHFINWYLNYALLISLAYILFLVLMWFINYIRRLLDKGMNIGNGSY